MKGRGYAPVPAAVECSEAWRHSGAPPPTVPCRPARTHTHRTSQHRPQTCPARTPMCTRHHCTAPRHRTPRIDWPECFRGRTDCRMHGASVWRVSEREECESTCVREEPAPSLGRPSALASILLETCRCRHPPCQIHCKCAAWLTGRGVGGCGCASPLLPVRYTLSYS